MANKSERPCALCSAAAYCCGAVAPRAIAALLGRFLPRLGPLAFASGPFFLCPGRDARLYSAPSLNWDLTNTEFCTAPALQRTAPQVLRAALRPGHRLLRRG